MICHGAYAGGPAFVGRVDVRQRTYSEIPLPKEYDACGHFTTGSGGALVCGGYFKQPGDRPPQRENSMDHGADPHVKNAECVSLVRPDWEKRILAWPPLCKNGTDWLGQDAHPHAIFSHRGDRVYFSSRKGKYVGVYSVSAAAESE